MKPNLIKKTSLAFAISLVAATLSIAAPYEKGQAVESFTTKDQHDQEFVFRPAETRYLLVTHDMDTGKKANAALNALGKDYLGSKKAVYMANIHGMPGVGRMFAMPKMKKYSHRIILADDEALIARFPTQEGKVTVLTLAGGKVKSVSYWTPGSEDISTYLK